MTDERKNVMSSMRPFHQKACCNDDTNLPRVYDHFLNKDTITKLGMYSHAVCISKKREHHNLPTFKIQQINKVIDHCSFCNKISLAVHVQSRAEIDLKCKTMTKHAKSSPVIKVRLPIDDTRHAVT